MQRAENHQRPPASSLAPVEGPCHGLAQRSEGCIARARAIINGAPKEVDPTALVAFAALVFAAGVALHADRVPLVMPSVPTVVAAILDALRPLGVKDIDMPATPQAIWNAIRKAKGG